MTQTIFIAGATGQQGSAVINALLNHPSSPNITIHGLTRDPTSPPAKSLLSKHPTVKLLSGSFDNIPALTKAVESCTSAFLNVTPVFTDPAGESRHTQNLVTVCASTSTMKRVVFSSSGAMHTSNITEVFNTYIPNNPNSWMTVYMTSKKACEEAVTSSEIEEGWSIIRGAMFYSNFIKPFTDFMYPDIARKQSISTALWPDYKTSIVDPGDIGKLAARMILSDSAEWSSQWKGKFVPLAKENITMDQIIGAMNQTLAKRSVRKQIKVTYIGDEEAKERIEKGDLVTGSQMYSNEYSLPFDLEEVKSFGIDIDQLVGAGEFYEREGEKVVETIGGAGA